VITPILLAALALILTGPAPALLARSSWPYKVPRALVPVAALPRNAMGKVVKPQVAQLFE